MLLHYVMKSPVKMATCSGRKNVSALSVKFASKANIPDVGLVEVLQSRISEFSLFFFFYKHILIESFEPIGCRFQLKTSPNKFIQLRNCSKHRVASKTKTFVACDESLIITPLSILHL